MYTFTVPVAMRCGDTVRTMVHRILKDGGTHPDDMRDVTNTTDAKLAAGSEVHCAPDLAGKWFVAITETRDPEFRTATIAEWDATEPAPEE